jgi:hypothetical protein
MRHYLLAAKAARLFDDVGGMIGNIPVLATNSSRSIKDTVRINLLLELVKLGIVGSEVGLAEVRIHNITLVTVATTARSHSLETLHDAMGEFVVNLGNLLLTIGVVPVKSSDNKHIGIAPGRVGRVGRGVLLLGIDVVDNENAFVSKDTLENVDGVVEELGVIPVLAGDETRPGTTIVITDVFSREMCLPGRVKAVMLKECGLGVNAELLPLVKEGLNNLLKLANRDVRDHPRVHCPEETAVASREHEAVAVAVLVRVLREATPVDIKGLKESLLRDASILRIDAPGHARELHLGVDSDSHGDDDAPSSSATATDSPKEISVLLLVGSDEAAIRCDDVNAEELVSSKTSDGADGGVATTGKIAASDTNIL